MIGLVIKDLLQIKNQYKIRDLFVLLGLAVACYCFSAKYFISIVGAVGLMIVSSYCNTLAICDARTK